MPIILLFDDLELNNHLLKLSAAPKGRRQQKGLPSMFLGTVARWNQHRAFGFILSDARLDGIGEDKEVYCHKSKLPRGVGYLRAWPARPVRTGAFKHRPQRTSSARHQDHRSDGGGSMSDLPLQSASRARMEMIAAGRHADLDDSDPWPGARPAMTHNTTYPVMSASTVMGVDLEGCRAIQLSIPVVQVD
jgi:cold shock CspA family protein